jgi:uncharacterized protein (UPF0548 family)
MFLASRPTNDEVEKFLESARVSPLSYSDAGMTGSGRSSDYQIDHSRVKLGFGSDTYDRACAALMKWKQFDLGWVELFPKNASIAVDSTVTVLVNHSLLWSLNASRIVYLVDDQDGPIKRFGFAYGTTIDHAERGEERFVIEWTQQDNSVWYDILAYSRPGHWLAKVGYPFTRWWQKRFARDSLKAMLREVSRPDNGSKSRERS